MVELNPQIPLAGNTVNLADTYYKGQDDATAARATEATAQAAGVKANAEAGKIKQEYDAKTAENDHNVMGQVMQGVSTIPPGKLTKQAMKQALLSQAHRLSPQAMQTAMQGLDSVPDDEGVLRQKIQEGLAQHQTNQQYFQQRVPDANAVLSAKTQAAGQGITQQNNLANQDLDRQQFGFQQGKFDKELGFNREKESFNQKNEIAKFGLDQQKRQDSLQNNLANQDLDRQQFGFQQGKFDKELGFNREKESFNQKNEIAKFGLDQQKRQDSLNPKTSGKAPTEFQGKSALYANRAQEAEDILSNLDYSPAALGTKDALSHTPLIGGVLGAVGNTMMSDTNQKAEQAQRNFVNAILRQESGAVISPSEFENAKKQYFPSVGDSDAVKEQKAQNRRVAIESIKNNAQGVMDTTVGYHGSTSSWDASDPKIAEKAAKIGATPEEYAAILKARGK